ncbi:leucyl aminopeptidase [Fistulifera solaris]|jgi:leucyl aminopeptidase|uniref:Leucyl aminopeptidase n=1 Tax=Fistulifera solaris TaxID=1519565 RepID=A0A1Z5JSQ5_FISSO|nr:leucyl aminopeptidase [Fistulifera solaris]|eukprot:GAX17060.1 leucyl aminopeptidase [Fistulifera solaris]
MNRSIRKGVQKIIIYPMKFRTAFTASVLIAPISAFSVPQRSILGQSLTARNMASATFPTWSFDKPNAAMEWNDVLDVTMSSGSSSEAVDLLVIGVSPPAKAEKEEDDDEEEEEATDKEPEPITLTGSAKSLDDDLSGALTDMLKDHAKSFKNGATVGGTTPTLRVASSTAKRIVLMGLGPEKDDKDWTNAGMALGNAVAAKCKAEPKVASCRVILPEAVTGNATTVRDFSTAFYQTLYADNRYKSGSNVKKVAEDLKSITLTTDGSDAVADAAAIEQGRSIARGIFLCKDIVNAPHNVLNSLSLADTARRIAEESGGSLQCKILNKDECEARGMGSFLGVARGSETEPQFIHITYKPKGEVKSKVGVIGKGLLFDTGGYNIKTAMMEMMKFDCGGAAAVLGAARAIGALQPEGVEAHFCVAACENMISDRAAVPSDILTASNGKTIEVMNTDAEGRLTLADALVYADKEIGCEKIIELSTLTGACMISLGKSLAGVWTLNDGLAEEIANISKVTGDKSWRMPMAMEYNDQLESKFADMKNIGGRYGGAITAALFLQKFVSKKKPFAHIDIAGPVWSDKESMATGYGTKLVTKWVCRQGEKAE